MVRRNKTIVLEYSDDELDIPTTFMCCVSCGGFFVCNGPVDFVSMCRNTPCTHCGSMSVGVSHVEGIQPVNINVVPTWEEICRLC